MNENIQDIPILFFKEMKTIILKLNISDCESETELSSDLLCASTPYASSARLQPNLQETVCVGYRTHWLVLCKGKLPPRTMQTHFKHTQIL